MPPPLIAVLLDYRLPLMRSADRRGVLQSALLPECIQATLDFERRVLAHVALEGFAVIADQLDDVVGPIVLEPEGLAEITFAAQQALDFRLVGTLHLIDVLRGNAQFFGS